MCPNIDISRDKYFVIMNLSLSYSIGIFVRNICLYHAWQGDSGWAAEEGTTNALAYYATGIIGYGLYQPK